MFRYNEQDNSLILSSWCPVPHESTLTRFFLATRGVKVEGKKKTDLAMRIYKLKHGSPILTL